MNEEILPGQEEEKKVTVESLAGPIIENDDGTVEVELGDLEPGEVIENEDGSAEVTFDDEEDAEVAEFYSNLVPQLLDSPEADAARRKMEEIAYDLVDKIEEDIQARAPRDDIYAEGIKRTGFSNDAPGGATFTGASRVAHPMIAQATVDYEARVMKEIFPATGPVKAHIVGTVTRRRQEKAHRVSRCMNWQLTKQMTEFRPSLERGEMQAALNGAAFLHWIPRDPILRRTKVELVNIDKVIMAAEASDFYSAERITILDDITQMTYESRVASGQYYEDLALSGGKVSGAPSQAPNQTKAEQAREKVEGKETPTRNEDGVRRVFVVNTFLSGIEELLGPESLFAQVDTYLPYLVYICEESYKVLGIVRNWEEDDDKFQRMHWLTELPFVPWEESNIGLVHLIGGLSAATTGALRALLDSAHVNNIPTAAVLKGSGVSGQSKSLTPTQIYEITAPVNTDDVRKVMMQLPYNEPSTVLYQLMTFLVDSAEGVVRTTFEKLSENNTNLPVGTTYALLEQGLTVVSSIMARQHYAMAQGFEVLYRINRMYLEDDEIRNEAGEVLAYRSDFNGPMDVVPVSDPNIPSDSHRMAQTQALAARADAKPELYNAREVEKQILQQLKVPDYERFLVPQQQPVEMNAANENMAASLGRPIMAFPEQDHIAHLTAHIQFLQSPFFGFLPIIAPTFIPTILAHIKEHLILWYVSKMFESLQTSVQAVSGPLAASNMGGGDIIEFMKLNNSDVNMELDRLIAEVSDDVLNPQTGDALELQELQIIQVIQAAQQVLQQYQPDQPMDPSQAQLAKTKMDAQVKREQIQANQQSKREQLQAQQQSKVADLNLKREQLKQGDRKNQTTVATTQIKEQGTTQREEFKQGEENKRAQARVMADIQMNDDDNATAMAIASAEITEGAKTNRSTGGDSSPGQ